MIDHVLIATDGSDCGTRAARAGVELAAACDAAATVVVAAAGELSTADAERVVERVVEGVVEDVAGGDGSAEVTVQSRVVAEPPRVAILEVAEEVDADVVAMGRHGHANLGERLLGGVTERVLRAAERPVLTVPAGGGDVGDYEDILVTSDGSDAARAAVRPGTALASTYDATLHLLSVVDVVRDAGPFSAGGVDQSYIDGLVDDAASDLDVFAAACEEALGADAHGEDALAIEQTVRTGTPAAAIAEYVEDAGVDLVAMASTGQGSLAGQLLGSTTDRVVRTVDVPVLVVPGRD